MMRDRRVLHDLVKEQRKARLAVADDALRPGKRGDGRGAFVAGQVDHEIKMLFPHAPDEAKQRRQAAVCAVLVDEHQLIQIFVFRDEIPQGPVRQQCDLCRRTGMAERMQNRRHKEQIADVHHIDDQNRLSHIASLIPHSDLCHVRPATRKACAPPAAIS